MLLNIVNAVVGKADIVNAVGKAKVGHVGNYKPNCASQTKGDPQASKTCFSLWVSALTT